MRDIKVLYVYALRTVQYIYVTLQSVVKTNQTSTVTEVENIIEEFKFDILL